MSSFASGDRDLLCGDVRSIMVLYVATPRDVATLRMLSTSWRAAVQDALFEANGKSTDGVRLILDMGDVYAKRHPIFTTGIGDCMFGRGVGPADDAGSGGGDGAIQCLPTGDNVVHLSPAVGWFDRRGFPQVHRPQAAALLWCAGLRSPPSSSTSTSPAAAAAAATATDVDRPSLGATVAISGMGGGAVTVERLLAGLAKRAARTAPGSGSSSASASASASAEPFVETLQLLHNRPLNPKAAAAIHSLALLRSSSTTAGTTATSTLRRLDLFSGATLWLRNEDAVQWPASLFASLEELRLTNWHVTPAMAEALCEGALRRPDSPLRRLHLIRCSGIAGEGSPVVAALSASSPRGAAGGGGPPPLEALSLHQCALDRPVLFAPALSASLQSVDIAGVAATPSAAAARGGGSDAMDSDEEGDEVRFVRPIQQLRSVRSLNLAFTRVSSRMIAKVARAVGGTLRRLDVSFCPTLNAAAGGASTSLWGLGVLGANLTSLRGLRAVGSQEAAWALLAALPNLTELALSDNAAALAAAAEAEPAAAGRSTAKPHAAPASRTAVTPRRLRDVHLAGSPHPSSWCSQELFDALLTNASATLQTVELVDCDRSVTRVHRLQHCRVLERVHVRRATFAAGSDMLQDVARLCEGQQRNVEAAFSCHALLDRFALSSPAAAAWQRFVEEPPLTARSPSWHYPWDPSSMESTAAVSSSSSGIVAATPSCRHQAASLVWRRREEDGSVAPYFTVSLEQRLEQHG